MHIIEIEELGIKAEPYSIISCIHQRQDFLPATFLCDFKSRRCEETFTQCTRMMHFISAHLGAQNLETQQAG